MSIIHSPPTSKVPTQVSNSDNSHEYDTEDDTVDSVDSKAVMKSMTEFLNSFEPQRTLRKGGKKTSPPKKHTAAAFVKAMNNLSNEMKNLRVEVSSTKNEVKALRADVKKTNTKIDTVLERVSALESAKIDHETKINDIDIRVTELEQSRADTGDTSKMEIMLDEIEQKTLDLKLILSTSNPIVSENRTSRSRTDEVRDFIALKLGMPTTELNSISAYQMDDTAKKFAIELDSPGLRQNLFKKCKELKPSDLFLNEFLTKRRHNTLYHIRKLRDNSTPDYSPKLKKVFSDHGRLFVVIDGQDRPKQVTSVDEVKNLCR